MAPLIEIEHLFDALKDYVRSLREGRETLCSLIYVGMLRQRGKFRKCRSTLLEDLFNQQNSSENSSYN